MTAPPTALPSVRRVADIPAAHAAVAPHDVALVCEDRTLTFEALERRTTRVAAALQGATPPRGRVALLDANSEVFFELFLGCAKSGRVLVPLNFRFELPEVVAVLHDARPDLIVVGGPFASMWPALAAQCPFIRQAVVVGPQVGGPTAGPIAGGGRMLAYDTWLDAPTASAPASPAEGDDIVLQPYTSGTSGYPKGVLLSNDNLLVLPPVLGRMFDCRRTDVALVCLPLFHVGGGLWGLGTLFAGMKTVVLRGSTPHGVRGAIRQHQVTNVFLVPALLQRMLDDREGAAADCASLHLVAYGGSPMPMTLLQTAMETLGCGFAQLYGLTETAGAVTVLTPADHADPAQPRLRSCGRPLDMVSMRVVDQRGQDVVPGAIGEVLVRAPHLMQGYWQRPDDTREAMLNDYFRTGDAGYTDLDGYLYLVDRIKDVIITGGENVYPAEVERVLAEHPAIVEVAVVGTPDPDWGEAVRAVVVLRERGDATADRAMAAALIDWCRSKLAGFKRPRVVDFVSALPRNAAGKVLKRELRA